MYFSLSEKVLTNEITSNCHSHFLEKKKKWLWKLYDKLRKQVDISVYIKTNDSKAWIYKSNGFFLFLSYSWTCHGGLSATFSHKNVSMLVDGRTGEKF